MIADLIQANAADGCATPADYAIRFLGVGSAQAADLGTSSAVFEIARKPVLLIDAGPGTLARYWDCYGAWPMAAFVTHTHFDHIGDLEAWFYKLAFMPNAALPKLFVPAALVPWLQRRIADFPNWVAEGGRNFWDVFQLIPVSESFWHAGLRFEVMAVRHHAPETAFGLVLNGSFIYSGDTRPIPDLLRHHATGNARIFHDCAPEPNPSHSGVSDLLREYGADLKSRLLLYHYPDASAAARYSDAGFSVVEAGRRYELSAPSPSTLQSSWAAWSSA